MKFFVVRFKARNRQNELKERREVSGKEREPKERRVGEKFLKSGGSFNGKSCALEAGRTKRGGSGFGRITTGKQITQRRSPCSPSEWMENQGKKTARRRVNR